MTTSRTFPVVSSMNYDVVIAGGGTTGIAAALASARAGARTLIIESLGFLGGNATNIPAWLGFHDLSGNRVVGGIAQELVEQMQAAGGATKQYLDPICGSVVGTAGGWVKIVAMRSVLDAGVDVLLHSLVVDAEMAASRVQGVYVQNKGGLHYISGDVVIDCTDSGDVARVAGVSMHRGRSGDGRTQVSSWMVTIGHVDFEKTLAYFATNPAQEIRPFPLKDPDALLKQMREADVFVLGAFRNLIQKAKADGTDLARDVLPGIGFTRWGEFGTVASRVIDVDPNDAGSMTRAEIDGMQQTEVWITFLRNYVPGFEACRLVNTPSHIGMRETNHMAGEYTLTEDDLMSGRTFGDAIGRAGYHLDIHPPEHSDIETKAPPAYQIPYRIMAPQGVEGLLVAGRAMSATHEAFSSIRVIPILMACGEAAGAAAALALQRSTTVRDVPIAELQTRLRNAGAII